MNDRRFNRFSKTTGAARVAIMCAEHESYATYVRRRTTVNVFLLKCLIEREDERQAQPGCYVMSDVKYDNWRVVVEIKDAFKREQRKNALCAPDHYVTATQPAFWRQKARQFRARS